MNLEKYTDSEGLIVGLNGGRDESVKLTGLMTGLLLLDDQAALADNYLEAMLKCQSFYNTWVNHPLDATEANEEDIDFITWSLAIWAILYNSAAARHIMKGLMNKYMTNLSLGIRMFNRWWLYPVLMISDFDLIIRITLDRETMKSDLHLAKDVLIANLKYSTPFSLLAKYLYKKTNFILMIDRYFNRSWNAQVVVGTLYKKICLRYL